jgi:hypothetical protein
MVVALNNSVASTTPRTHQCAALAFAKRGVHVSTTHALLIAPADTRWLAAVAAVVTGIERYQNDPNSLHSFDDYWQPFLRGQGPAGLYATSLAQSGRCWDRFGVQ